jgi:hypothetical protein
MSLLVVPPNTIQDQFEEFHRTNPWVFDALVRLARDLRSRGRKRIGMKMLFEVLRWEYLMKTDDPSSDFKLNNNYHSRYARLIANTVPDLVDAFETRTLKAA